jgi:hypothetical protein
MSISMLNPSRITGSWRSSPLTTFSPGPYRGGSQEAPPP